MAKAYIGTSGWSYKGWKESFLEGVPQSEWLSYCAERFTGIEVNGTFYRLQSKDTFRKWRDETPADLHALQLQPFWAGKAVGDKV